jgi:hypothetical protein
MPSQLLDKRLEEACGFGSFARRLLHFEEFELFRRI